MTRRPPSVHWLRENAQERSPHRVLVVDTETRPASEADPDRHVLRLWSARLIRRHATEPAKPRREDHRGRTAGELVELITRVALSNATTWIVTHNLTFDLAVTELPVLLTAAGWRISEAALTTDDPWCRMTRGSRRLVIADSFSWLPTSVAELGRITGHRKPELPAYDDGDAAWWSRCDADVDITARAILSAMDWWDAGKLGNWSITGPATGWSSYRHRRPHPHVLVVPDPVDRAWEMRAVTGGRKEVRRLGPQPLGLYADLDIATAHLTAMAALPLPFRRLSHNSSLALDSRHLRSQVTDVMGEALVSCSQPRYPWDSGRGTLYPIGTFRSQLAGPELREAADRGELRSIGRNIVYLTDPHMAGWAMWLASLLDVGNPDVPPAVRLLAKHWSRCVPGKWAGHASEVIEREPDPRPGWAIERAVLMPERRPADLLRVGGERWTIVRDEWADDAFPAILAWIQSATRVAISRLIDMVGPALLSCNTDGALVDVGRILGRPNTGGRQATMRTGPALAELDAMLIDLDPVTAPFSVRIKRAARFVSVISPQHLVLDEERRLAGIPARAIALAGGRYTFTQWPKLRVQLSRDQPAGYRTVPATVDLAHVAPGGWLTSWGEVVPVRVDQGPDEAGRVCPPDAVGLSPADLAAPELQHAALRPWLVP